jgi:hypothetical protein
MGCMEMSFSFDIADSSLASGQLDHKVLLAVAISRQASGPTARLMLNSVEAHCEGGAALPLDPLAVRIDYFSNTRNQSDREFTALGSFYVPREKCTSQRFQNNELAVYQDVSANRKQNEIIECISGPISVSTGQENLRHI